MEFLQNETFSMNQNYQPISNFKTYKISFVPKFDFLNSKVHSYTITHLLVFSVLCLGLFLKKFRTRKEGSNYVSYGGQIPYAKFIEFAKLPVLDGIILLHRFRRDGVKMVQSLVTKYGPNFRVSVGFRQYLAVSDPVVIQKLLSSAKPGHLEKAKYLYDKVFTDCVKDGLIPSKYEIWSPHRKALAPAMSYKSISTYLKFIIEGAKDIAKESCDVATLAENGEICNNEMKEIIESRVLEIITKIILGSESIYLSNEQRQRFHFCFRRAKDISSERFHRPELFIPIIWWLHPLKHEQDRMIAEIRQISIQMADMYRSRNDALDDERKPCEQVLNKKVDSTKNVNEESPGIKPFKSLLEKMTNSGFSNKEITEEVTMFLVAGHETVVTALDMLIFHLAGNIEHQVRCREEVDNFFNSKMDIDHAHCKLNMEDFTPLKYLERCILESMRLTPTVPFSTLRELHEPLKIEDDLIIETGETVIVLTWCLHRNPEYYPDPEVFNPDRFLPENVKGRHSHSFIPFSMGPRNCIGWKIAMLEMKAVMAWILRHFEMTTTDKPEDVKLVYDITLKPERNYDVTFRKRNTKDF